jgi:glycine cleavage system H protein
MTNSIIPSDRLHTMSHEWLQALPDGNYAVGISHAGQAMLGDIVFCGDAKIGQSLKAGEVCAVVESVKAASDVHMPIDGTVLAFNSAVIDADPTALNINAYGTWIVKIAPLGSVNLKHLMSPADYTKQI